MEKNNLTEEQIEELKEQTINRVNKITPIVFKIRGLIMGLPFIFIGLVFFLVSTISIINNENKVKNGITITGTLIKTEKHLDTKYYDAYYEYVVDGKKYEVLDDTLYTEINDIGKTKEIKYNKENPKKAIVKSNNGFSLILFGITAIAIGIIVIYMNYKSSQKKLDKEILNEI